MKNTVFEKYRDIHKNKRVFLIGNGPSLADTDLDLIKNEISIAMNRIPLIYNKNKSWRPTYYLFSSTNVKPEKPWHLKWKSSVIEAVSEKKTTPFISETLRSHIDPRGVYNNIKWFSSMSEYKPDASGNISEKCFSKNIIDRIDKSGTTMNLALQIAYFMGFNEIVFLGADLGWKKDLATNNDPNHFHKEYTADIPRPYKANNQMRNIHSLAYKIFKERNKDIKFYNASLSTVLDVYPIIDYKDYINNKITYRTDVQKEAKMFWDKNHQFLM